MMANGMPIPVPPKYAEILRSPLLPYPQTFVHDKTVLGLSAETAEILDDVRFLTLSISSESEPGSTGKIRSTAACESSTSMFKMFSLTLFRATQTSIRSQITFFSQNNTNRHDLLNDPAHNHNLHTLNLNTYTNLHSLDTSTPRTILHPLVLSHHGTMEENTRDISLDHACSMSWNGGGCQG